MASYDDHQLSVLNTKALTGLPDNRVVTHHFLMTFSEFLRYLHRVRARDLLEDDCLSPTAWAIDRMLLNRSKRCKNLAGEALSKKKESLSLSVGRGYDRKVLLGGDGAAFVAETLGIGDFKDVTYGAYFGGKIKENMWLVGSWERKARVRGMITVVLEGFEELGDRASLVLLRSL